jgi:protoporphyrinogen oxidase
MVKDENTVWLGLEYFCTVGDTLWQKPHEEFTQFAIAELQSIGIINSIDVIDSTCIKMEKTYPAYFGTYNEFDKVKDYLNNFKNLFCVGRNGMHKYNNSDHSMLTAMTAVDNIIANKIDKENIWQINTEQEYHEEK